MFYIKLDDEKDLIVTVEEPIYEGENLNEIITFLIPQRVCELDVEDAMLILNFVRADNVADSVVLTRDNDLYAERFYQYHMPIRCNFTRAVGIVRGWIEFFIDGEPDNIVLKTGEFRVNVRDAVNGEDFPIVPPGDYSGDTIIEYVDEKVGEEKSRAESIEDSHAARLDSAESSIEALQAEVISSADKNYIHTQASPSNRWIVNHNLEKHPAITVCDSAGTVVCGDVSYIDLNTVEITFSAGFSGKCYCN